MTDRNFPRGIKKQPDHKVIGLRPRFFRGLLWSWIIQREPLQEAETIYTKKCFFGAHPWGGVGTWICSSLSADWVTIGHLEVVRYRASVWQILVYIPVGVIKKGQTVYFSFSDHKNDQRASVFWRFIPRILGPSSWGEDPNGNGFLGWKRVWWRDVILILVYR